jgi:membrane protease YdiL (CAAX protease family)
MKKLTDWIKRYQVLAFFILTYTITWGLGFSYAAVINRGLGFSYAAVINRGQFFLAPLFFIATCGPALAGIIVSTIINSEPKKEKSKAFWGTFLISWPVAALVAISYNILFNHTPLSPAIVILCFICVVPVTFVIASSKSRNPTVRNYVSSLIQFRGVWQWALATMFLFSASILLAVLINNLLFDHPISLLPLPATGLSFLGLVVVKFLYQIFFFNAIGEEVGWRGFALPKLQAQTSPLVAAIVIGIFWPPWHFFLWQAEGRPVLTLSFWSTYIVGHILFSILLTWFYNRSKGSILVVGIAHASVNTAMGFIPFQNLNTLNFTWAMIALMLILFERMWEKKPLYKSEQIDHE